MRYIAVSLNTMLYVFVTAIGLRKGITLKSKSGTYMDWEFLLFLAFVLLTSLVSLYVLCSGSKNAKKPEETEKTS